MNSKSVYTLYLIYIQQIMYCQYLDDYIFAINVKSIPVFSTLIVFQRTPLKLVWLTLEKKQFVNELFLLLKTIYTNVPNRQLSNYQQSVLSN